jgi:hypothetical protein
MATKEFNITGNGVQYMNDVAQASEQSAQGFKSAKAELRALQNQMLEMDQSSEEFKKASQRASELKDNIADLAQELNANAGNAFEQVSNNIGLFGDRIMSLDFKGAGIALSGFGNALGQLNFKTIKEELGGLIKGLGDMGKALMANPIFLVAGAIGAVIAYWDELSKAVDNFTMSQDEAINAMMTSDAVMKEMESVKIQEAQIELLVRAVNDHTLSEEQRTSALEKVNKALKENGMEAINDINATNDIINAKNNLILKLQQEAKVRGKLKYLEELYAKQAQLMNAKNTESTMQLSEAQRIAMDKMGLTGTMFGDALNAYADFGLSLTGSTVTELDNLNKEIQFISEDIYNDQQAMNSLQIENTQKTEQKKNDIIKKAGQDKKKTRDQLMQEEADALKKAMEEAYEAERVNERNLDLLYETQGVQRIEGALQTTNKVIEIKKVENDALDALDAEQALRAEQRQRELNAKRLQMASDVFGALGNLAESFGTKSEKDAKRQFEVVKAFNLAQAIVATYTAVNNALTAGGNPAKLATGAQFVEAGVALAAGLANVIKIQQTKFESKTTPSGGGGLNGSTNVGGSPSPLSLSFLQNQPNQQPPFQAYVISGQVSNSIEAQQLINNQSKL